MRTKRLGTAKLSKAALVSVLIAVGAIGVPAAHGAITGFNNGVDYTLLASPNAVTAGAPAFADPETLQITNLGPPNGQATAVWHNIKQDVTTFQAKFDYTMAGFDTWVPADGIVFVLQNDGLNAMGATGGARGYSGTLAGFDPLNASAGMAFNIYSGAPGSSGTGSDVQGVANGAFGSFEPTAPVNLISGNTIRATITYDGTTAYLDLLDLTTLEEFSTSVEAPVPLLVGGNTAYVGFTGGTGGANALQEITNFSYTKAPILTWDGAGPGNWNAVGRWTGGPPDFPDLDTIAHVNTNIVTVAGADAAAFVLDVSTGGIAIDPDRTLAVGRTASFGPATSLTLGERATVSAGSRLDLDPTATLTVGNDAAVITSDGSLGAASTLGNATFDISGSASATSLTAGPGTVTKKGPGILMLDDSAGSGISAPNTTFKIEGGGELKATGPDPLGGSTSVHLNRGRLTIDGGAFGAPGDIAGFTQEGVGPTDFTLNTNGTVAGIPNITAGVLQITSNDNGEASSAYYNTLQNVSEFTVQFDYQLVPPVGNPADGVTFVIQNTGLSALGGGGGSLGYSGIGSSVALALNIYDPGAFDPGVRLMTGGAIIQDYDSTTPVDLRSANVIRNTLRYDGGTLRLEMEDLTTHETVTKFWDINIPGLVGGNTAYLGFTGATGGLNANQQISNFTNALPSYPINQQNTAVLVTDDSTLGAITSGAAAFGPLTIDNATLTTMGAKGGISFRAPPKAKAADTTILSTATRAGFDPRVATDYGTIDASNADVEISKEGPGKWVLSDQPLNLSPNATWAVNGGTFELQGTDPIGGRPISVNSGLLTMQGGDKLGGADVTLAGGRMQIHDGRGGYSGDITGFTQEAVGPTDFTLNSNGTVGGVPSITAGVLEITTSANNEAASAFYNTPQDARAFRVEFDYQMVDPGTNASGPADGASIVIQNSPAGVNALGLAGGGMGYQNLITESAGIMLNIWPWVGNATGSDVQLGNNGGLDDNAFRATSPINLASGNPIHTTVIYDGRDITVEMEDTVTGSTYSTVFAGLDIPSIVGSDTAYVGFTGGTGGANSTQHFSNVTNQFSTVPINTDGLRITVTDDSVLEANTHGAAPFGPLTMDSGVLTTTGAFLGGISFRAPPAAKIADTTIDPGATEVGFDPQAPTDYGTIDAGNAAVTIVKAGSSHWTLGTQPDNLGPDAKWRVDDGVFELTGTDPIGGRPITVAGGLLTMVGGDQLGGADLTLAGGRVTIQGTGVLGSDVPGLTEFGTDPTDFTPNANGPAAAAGVPNIAAGELQITSNDNSEATSVYYNTPQDIGAFHTEFDYQFLSGSTPRPADGASFVVQNAGIGALGAGGGGLGYSGINESVALLLNIWDGWPRGHLLAQNGAWNAATYQSNGGVQLLSTNPIHIELDYDGNQFVVSMEDLVTGDTMSRSYPIDIPAAVGGTGALVGFTGGTGGATADQRIRNFSISYPIDPVVQPDVDVLVTQDSSLHAATHSSASFGQLTMQNGILKTSGAFTGGISFNGPAKAADTLIDPAATDVGFNPLTYTDLGVVDGQGTPAIIRKVGPGDLILDKANVNLQNAVFSAEGGRLIGVPAAGVVPLTNPFNGAELRLANGELVLAAKATGEDVTYLDPVTVDSDSTLTGGAGGAAGAPGPVTVRIGNVALPVTLNNSSALALQSTDDYVLDVAGPFGGSGDLDVIGGTVNVSGGGSADRLTLTDGNMTLDTDLNVTNMILGGGTGNTHSNAVVVNDTLSTQNRTRFTIDPGNTFTASGSDMGSEVDLTLSSGTLTAQGPGGGGDILGFGDGSDFTLNANAQAQAAGVPNILDGVLQVISADANEATSAWFDTPQNIAGGFAVVFDYQMVDAGTNATSPADGLAFVVQNDTRGTGALGGAGGNRGYNGVNPSVAVLIDVWTGGDGRGLQLGTNGSIGASVPTDPVDLAAVGNVIHAVVGYDGASSLTVDLEDRTTGNTFNHVFDIDLSATIGGDTAYFGFTGGTGGANADIRLSNFTNALDMTPIEAENVNIVAVADSTLELVTLGDARLGNLTIDPGVTLTITGAAARFHDVTTGHDATIVGNVAVVDNLYVGGSPGLLHVSAPNGSFEFGENAAYNSEIGAWDSENVTDPWNPIPPGGPVNDRFDMTAGDALLGGELVLLPIGKLSPPHPAPGNPQVLLQWYGHQTRIIASAGGENSVGFQFDAVPEALPKVPNIGTNWGQGHLGEGVFLTRETNTMGDADPQDLLIDQPGISYFPNATLVHLFQAADGDTNGDGTLDGLDLQAIQAAQTFGTGAPADWTTGDFTDGVNGDSAGVTDGEDLQAILATGLWGTPQPYAAVDPGDPGDGVVDLILDPGPGGLSLSTDGVVINGYVIKSRDGIFTGEPAQNLGAFQIDNDQEISGNFFFTLAGEHFFGNVIGSEWEMLTRGGGVNPFEDLTFTYTRVDMPGTFFGNLIVIPEPGTVVMLLGGAVALVLLALRRRRTA